MRIAGLPAGRVTGVAAGPHGTALVTMAISFVATIYPSWRASRVNPAEALRYE